MYPTRHALLRDRDRWEATIQGLVADADGTLSLAPLPSLTQAVERPGPYDAEPSGVAAAACCSMFVADTAAARVIYRDGLCHDEAVLPRPGADCGVPLLMKPRGLSINRKYLAVADGGRGQVLLFRAHDLSLATLVGPFAEPWAALLDGKSRLYVLDHGTKRVTRMNERGVLDSAYSALLATALTDPAAIALNAADELLVSDAATNRVLRFAPDGTARGTLTAPSPSWRPRAVAADGSNTYVFDASSGVIHVFSGTRPIGTIAGVRAPVSALAAAEGALHIKLGLDAEVITACTDVGVVASGELLAGPLDAGDRDGWERVDIEAAIPADTRIELAVFFDATDTPPAAHEWIAAPAHDVLLGNLTTPPNYPGRAPERRYLWIKIRLHSQNDRHSPKLMQVHAATADENYLRHLPAVYAQEDRSTVLERFLALARTQIGGGEVLLRALPQLSTAQFAPASALPWLAGWLAFELPSGLEVQAQRQLLSRVADLYRRRGTVAGLIEFIQLYTGIRAHVIEWARERRVWQLGVTSALGFDTALPSGAVDGIVVADPAILGKTQPPWGCQEPERVVVGHAVVGADRPLAPEDFGAILFDDAAHRITVMIPAGQAQDAAVRARLREVIAAEVPAHVIFDVCFIEPRLRIGMQARIGIDAVIAGEPAPLRLSEAHLGEDSRLGSRSERGVGAGPNFYIGQQARIGSALVLG